MKKRDLELRRIAINQQRSKEGKAALILDLLVDLNNEQTVEIEALKEKVADQAIEIEVLSTGESSNEDSLKSRIVYLRSDIDDLRSDIRNIETTLNRLKPSGWYPS